MDYRLHRMTGDGHITARYLETYSSGNPQSLGRTADVILFGRAYYWDRDASGTLSLKAL